MKHLKEHHEDVALFELNKVAPVPLVECEKCGKRVTEKKAGGPVHHKCTDKARPLSQVEDEDPVAEEPTEELPLIPDQSEVPVQLEQPMETLWSEIQLSELVSGFYNPLYTVSHSWCDEFRQITMFLLKKLSTLRGPRLLETLAAFLVLPGLVGTIKMDRGDVGKYLRSWLPMKTTGKGRTAPKQDPQIRILKEAQRQAHKKRLNAEATGGGAGARTKSKEQLIQEIDRMCADNKLGGAFGKLQDLKKMVSEGSEASTYLPLTTERIADIIGDLHPEAGVLDRLEPALDEPCFFHLTAHNVLSAVRRLKPGKSQGSSGWTSRAITSVLLDSAEADSAQDLDRCQEVNLFIGRCFRGEFPEDCCRLWAVSRAALLPKDPEKVEYRPLGIGESWYRLMAQVIARAFATHAANVLAPLQVACGVPGGSEIAAHAAQLAYNMAYEHEYEYEHACDNIYDNDNMSSSSYAARTATTAVRAVPQVGGAAPQAGGAAGSASSLPVAHPCPAAHLAAAPQGGRESGNVLPPVAATPVVTASRSEAHTERVVEAGAATGSAALPSTVALRPMAGPCSAGPPEESQSQDCSGWTTTGPRRSSRLGKQKGRSLAKEAQRLPVESRERTKSSQGPYKDQNATRLPDVPVHSGQGQILNSTQRINFLEIISASPGTPEHIGGTDSGALGAAPPQAASGTSEGTTGPERQDPLVLHPSLRRRPGEASSTDFGLCQLDIRNAFNSMPRSAIQQGIRRYAQPLERWFVSFYGMSTELRTSDGSLVGWSQTGVRQGDPMAFLLFCLGFQDTIEKLDTLLSRAHGDRPCGTIAYADDVHVYGNLSIINGVVEDMIQIIEDAGLQVRRDKCHLIGRAADKVVSPRLQASTHGICLGNPVGCPDFRREYIAEQVNSFTSTMDVLHLLHPQSALAILRHCISSKPLYLTRICGEKTSEEALILFDSRVNTALKLLLQTSAPMDANFGDLRALPPRYGGLGIQRFSGVFGEKAAFLSREMAFNALYTSHPGLRPALNAWAPSKADSSIRHLRSVQDDAARAKATLAGAAINDSGQTSQTDRSVPRRSAATGSSRSGKSPSHGSQSVLRRSAAAGSESIGGSACSSSDMANAAPHIFKALDREEYGKWKNAAWLHSDRFYRQRSAEIHQALLAKGKKQQAAWFLSGCAKGSTRWIDNSCSWIRFSPQEFRDALRLRLLSPAIDNMNNIPYKCTCSQAVRLDRAPLHLLFCGCTKGLAAQRHNKVVSCLYQALRSGPLKKSGTVQMEVLFPEAKMDKQGHQLKADLRIMDGPKTYCVDVAVVNPAADKFVGPASQRSGVAASRAYSRKISKYAEHGVDVVPFILEAAGRLESRALTWLKTVVPDAFKRSYIMSMISTQVALYNAKMVHVARQLCRLENY